MKKSLDPFITSALLRQQLVLHVLARSGARIWLVVSPFGWADTTGLRLLVALFLAYDAALALRIWRGRIPLSTRWTLDAVDVSCWAWLCAADAPYTAAVVVAVPLMLVVAVERGIGPAVCASVALAAVVASVRVVHGGQPFIGDTLMYLGMAVVLGAFLSGLLHAERRRQAERARVVTQADLVVAVLAGRNDVLTGVGADAIDELQSSIMRLSAARVDAAMALRAAVSQHKQRLGEQTRTEAVYLRDALDTYSRATRLSQPAVARHVFFTVRGADAVRVLSRSQEKQLFEQLTAAGVVGELLVHVPSRPPREPVVIEIGGARMVLPPNQEVRVRLPVAPVGTLGLALYVLSMSNTNYNGVPPYLTVPLGVLVLGYAAAGIAMIRRFGDVAEPWVAVGALAPFILVAALTTHAATVTGPAPITLLGPLVGVTMLLGSVIRPPVAVAAAWAAAAAAAAAVVWTVPSLPVRYIGSEFIWPVVAFLGAHLVGRAVHRLSADLSIRLTRDGALEVERRRRWARRVEWEFIWGMLRRGEALCLLAEPGDVRIQVTAELTRIRGLLVAQAPTAHRAEA